MNSIPIFKIWVEIGYGLFLSPANLAVYLAWMKAYLIWAGGQCYTQYYSKGTPNIEILNTALPGTSVQVVESASWP